MDIQHRGNTFPQVKICGLTRVGQAVACAGAGADAIGLVFFAGSPRNVSKTRAREISGELPQRTARVGVFVDASWDFIMRRIDTCHLTAVQLHGREAPGLIQRLRKSGVVVIKTLFIHREPGLQQASRFAAEAYLVECGRGPLPGGNALAWNFEEAREFGTSHPLILAGGLSPDNVSRAIRSACPDALDVSSGVEAQPGTKDLKKVGQFMQAVLKNRSSKPNRRIF